MAWGALAADLAGARPLYAGAVAIAIRLGDAFRFAGVLLNDDLLEVLDRDPQGLELRHGDRRDERVLPASTVEGLASSLDLAQVIKGDRVVARSPVDRVAAR